MGRKGRVAVIAAVSAVVGLAGWLVMSSVGKEETVSSGTGTAASGGGRAVAEVSRTDLEKVARTRVFFAHQSVGLNILNGISAEYQAQGLPVPTITETRTVSAAAGTGAIAHTMIGENTKPLSKIEDFAKTIRGGVGPQVDVAVMKMCYIDISPGTDVDAVFATYRDTMAALEQEYPNVTFVKVTVPLTTEEGRLSRLRAKLAGGSDEFSRAANVARERLNTLIRTEYAGEHLFDLAAVESTTSNGQRVGGSVDGHPYYVLHDSFAADEGHLNAEGSRRAAAAWLAVVAGASSR
jgi:hypothetical protein